MAAGPCSGVGGRHILSIPSCWCHPDRQRLLTRPERRWPTTTACGLPSADTLRTPRPYLRVRAPPLITRFRTSSTTALSLTAAAARAPKSQRLAAPIFAALLPSESKTLKHKLFHCEHDEQQALANILTGHAGEVMYR